MESNNAEQFSFPRRVWRIIYPVLIFLSIQIIIGVLVGVIGGIASGVQDEEELAQLVAGYGMHIVLVSNIIGLAVFAPMWLRARRRLLPRRNGSPFALNLLVAGLFAGFNIVLVFIISTTDVLRFFPSYDALAELITDGHIILQIVTIGLAAPIVEELVFRGILINRMNWLPVWLAVVIQAALFGFVHMNMFQSLYAFVLGIMLGMAYVKFRSVIVVISGHIAFNLINVLLNEFISEDAFWIALIVGTAVMAVCAVSVIKKPRAQGAAIPAAPEQQMPL
jgi:hypothetical protein